MMDLDELRTVRRTEREKDSLQHLRDSFYEDVAAYLADLEARRDRAAAEAENPFASTEVRKLTDRIETAEEVSEAIYERRVGKIVKQASFAAADMSADRGGLTEEEAKLYDDIVDRIKQNKATVLDTLAGEPPGSDTGRQGTQPQPEPGQAGGPETETRTASEAEAAAVPEEAPSTAPEVGADATESGDPVRIGDTETAAGAETAVQEAESSGMLADAMGEGAEPDDGAPSERDGNIDSGRTDSDSDQTESIDRTEPADRSDPPPDRPTSDQRPTTDGGATQLKRTTVRITRDVGEIFGVDEREYTLEREDVVTLPATNAEPLVERDAAERLE